MTELWHADFEITKKIARQCIETQFSEILPIKHIECIGEGWDNIVYLVNDEIVFRFPRRKIAISLLARENTALNLVQNKLSIAVPNPIYVGQPSLPFPYPFQGYEILTGTAASHLILPKTAYPKATRRLAKFLRTLHAIDIETPCLKNMSPVFDRMNKEEMCKQLLERVHKINDRKITLIDLAIYQQEVELIKDIVLNTESKCLIHGDLYNRHLLFKGTELTGVIDWGDVAINHKSVDLALVYSFIPAELRPLFFEHYGIVSDEAKQYARFLGLYSALTVLLYAYDIGDPVLVNSSYNSAIGINSKLISKI